VEVSNANFPTAPIGVIADYEDSTVEILATCTDYVGAAVLIAPPVPGTVVIHANVQLYMDHVTGTDTRLGVGIGTSMTDCDFEFVWDAYIDKSASAPSEVLKPIVPITHIAEVGPGLNWFYVTAQEYGGAGSTSFWYAGIDAVFYPDP
jgi:hypothetical protein